MSGAEPCTASKIAHSSPNVGAGNKAQPADEGSAEIGDDVAVEVLHQQHVVLVRVHHQLHAGVVDDVLAVGDLRVLFRDLREQRRKRPSDSFMMLALWMA